MRRRFYGMALIALLAAMFAASPSFAHGPNHHASRAASAGPSDQQPAASAITDEAPILVAADSHRLPASECPGAADEACCANHCCAPGGIALDPVDVTPDFTSAKAVVASDRPPADAMADPHLRPPCR